MANAQDKETEMLVGGGTPEDEWLEILRLPRTASHRSFWGWQMSAARKSSMPAADPVPTAL